jgi:hypothetical protein
VILAAALLALSATLPAPAADRARRGPPRGTRGTAPKPFGGAAMTSPSLTTSIIKGFIFIRVRCAPGTYAGFRRPNDFGFCTGTISLNDRNNRRVASSPFGIRSGDSWSIDIPASKTLQASAKRAGRLSLNVAISCHDGQGQTASSSGHLTLLPSK